MTASIERVAVRYELSASLEMSRHPIDDGEIAGFDRAVRSLLHRLGPEADDAYWQRVVARLRRVRWEIATVPLPLRHPGLDLPGTAALLGRWLRDCERVFPAFADSAAELIARIADLGASDKDPLASAIVGLQRRNDSVPPAGAVLLRDVRHAGEVSEHLAQRGAALDVVVPSQLASGSTYERMIVVGPSVWFPRHVFSSPMARRLDLVHFGWIRDPSVETGILSIGHRSEPARRVLRPHEATSHQPVDAVDLVPVTDWATIASRTGGSTGAAETRADTVTAYLLLLASGDAVYLEAEEGSRAYVVDLTAGKELHQVPTSSIQPGAYLVTRVGGEGDYIPAIADALLGSDAERLRASQRRWKERLRAQIAAAGLHTVARRVAAAGAPRASDPNIRRWASPESIRTSDFADFQGLMTALGLEREAQQLWHDMDLIDQAHLRAGQRVRALLNREIVKADTSELERCGWSDFDVPEIEGEGALRVARVEARAPEIVRVSVRETRQLRRVERDLWQG